MSILAAKTDGLLRSWLQRAVDAGIDGVGPFRGGHDLVEPLRRRGMTAERITDRLVTTQSGQAAVQGAVASVGGIATAALGAPIGLAATLLVQARLAAAIADAYGHDLSDPVVRDAIGTCVWGTTEAVAAKSTGVAAGTKAASVVLPRIQANAAKRAAARVAAGKSAGAITSRVAGSSLSKVIPVLGAVIGGAFDLVSTRRVATRAREIFAASKTKTAAPQESQRPVAPSISSRRMSA
jgi:hypothetical protein